MGPTIDRATLEALASTAVDGLDLPGTCKAEAGITKALARELLEARREIARLTPPEYERYVRCSTQIVEEFGEWSRPVRLRVTERPDGFLELVAARTYCDCVAPGPA